MPGPDELPFSTEVGRRIAALAQGSPPNEPGPTNFRDLSDAELTDRFSYRSPTAAGATRHATLTAAFIALARQIDTICPPGRDKALAQTYLENAKFRASAAVARNPETR